MTTSLPHSVSPLAATARVIHVTKTNDAASLSHVGLGVTACCTSKTLRKNGIWSEVWPCTSAEMLREKLVAADARAVARNEVPPSHVVIHAPWIQTDDLARLARDFPETTFIVISHSNWGFLAADPHAVKLMREAAHLQRSTHNVRIGGNAQKFVAVASEIWGVDVAWVPNLYDMTTPFAAARPPWPGRTLRLGLFGAARMLKNGVTATAAAIQLSMRYRVPTELYVSAERADGEVVVNAIRELTDDVPDVTLVYSGWQSWAKFRHLVATMDLLLQPSFTESFNVVTADGIAEGVPSVVSPAIDWAPARWQANPDDADDVANVADYLLHARAATDDGRAALTAYVTKGLAQWREFLVPTK
jgi:glycosyltransferase involved in cell wall biosynthesis